MKLTLTQLRANLYNIVDEVIASGIPVEIERQGKKVKISLVEPRDKLSRLKRHKNVLNCKPEELVHSDWSTYWQEDKKL